MTTDAQRNELITDAKSLMADADEIVKSMASAIRRRDQATALVSGRAALAAM